MRYVTKQVLKKVYKKRDKWSHKGNFGKLVVITGSGNITGGAPYFVGMGAYRAGCDVVYIVAPERAADIAGSFSPLLITEPLRGNKLEEKHTSKILSLIEEMRATAIVIGPGLWRKKETRKAVVKLIEKIDLPMVIDADAIRAISSKKEILKIKKCVLTPHADEFREFSGIKVKNNVKDRINVVKNQAKKTGAVILLKGYVDVISDGKKTVLNKTGTPFMTTGGCGDTLTGICGAYLARGIDAFTSACAAAYVNGKAGEIVAKKYGESLLPTDLIDNIYKVIV